MTNDNVLRIKFSIREVYDFPKSNSLCEIIDKTINRLAELEAENAELKKTNFQQGFHIAELQGELTLAQMQQDLIEGKGTALQVINVYKPPTREQIAALVNGLEWYGKAAKIDGYGAYEVGCNIVSAQWFWAFCNTSGSVICTSTDDALLNTEYEARAAAEQHHVETVLSLLNI